MGGMRGDWVRRYFSGFMMLGLVIATGQAVAVVGVSETQIQWPVKDSSFTGSWPADLEWTPISGLNDPANDVSPVDNVWNFVGDARFC